VRSQLVADEHFWESLKGTQIQKRLPGIQFLQRRMRSWTPLVSRAHPAVGTSAERGPQMFAPMFLKYGQVDIAAAAAAGSTKKAVGAGGKWELRRRFQPERIYHLKIPSHESGQVDIAAAAAGSRKKVKAKRGMPV